MMDEFCREKGIKREYSVARTPQQNGVAERKNRTLIEAARTMLADSKLPTTFWAEVVSTFLLCLALQIVKEMAKWLFDLDSLTQSMNYVPVVARTFSNEFIQDASYFDDASPRSIADAQLQDQNGTHDDCSLQNNGTADQQINTASPEVNTGSRVVSTAVPEEMTHQDTSYMVFLLLFPISRRTKQRISKAFIDPSRVEAMQRYMSVNLPGFEIPDHPDKVYKVVKALDGTHQAPRAWYRHYDIIFGSTKKELCDGVLEKLMKISFR
ncbi:putative ribonuclease H-like domain-containing protein [Tanacetum coccineum]|uniref:Ribonuclease H-like domain-containing protein n=1 Tax=Tanacetum coccineum TaxID=301880 RepID=A0ABQ4WAH3_9ASTR